jgi:CHAT domain-containing protein/Flp pilus assembly protein TadD
MMLRVGWCDRGVHVFFAAFVGLVIGWGIDIRSAYPQTYEASTLTTQAYKLYQQGRYSEAILLAQRALNIREKSLGPIHPDVATALNNLALVYEKQGQHADAEPLYKRSLAIYEKTSGPDHPHVATALNNLASLYYAQGRYAEVEQLYKRSLAIREKAFGPDHPDVAPTLNNLANLYRAQGRYADAEPLYKRQLAIWEKSFNPDNAATTLDNLAGLYHDQGRYAESEPLRKRSLAVREKSLGRDHPSVASSLNNLALLYKAQGRYAEAEPLYKRSLAIQKRSNPEHPDVGKSLTGLAQLYLAVGRHTDAEQLYKQALVVFEKALGPSHPNAALALNDLAALYSAQGRYADAEPLYRRSLGITEKSLGPEHPGVATSLNNLAELYRAQGRYTDAEPLFKRALAIYEKTLGPDHPNIAAVLTNHALLYLQQGRWREALPLVRTAIERGHVNRSAHLAVLLGARRAKEQSDEVAITESFVVVQRAASSAASVALSQLAVRFSAGSDELAQLVRKDQDLSAEHEKLDRDLLAAFSKPPNQRDANQEAAIRKRLEEIAAARAEVGRILAQRFPDYAALSKPQPLPVSDVSSLLSDDEALVLIDLGKGKNQASYIWVVDRSGAVWNPINAKSEELDEQIAALRASLDPDSSKPFDAKLAYKLYKLIIGPVEDRIAKKPRLLMVMNGALTSIPPQVFVTSNPAKTKSPDWLIRRHAIAILPSVYSLKILRGKQAKSSVPKPLIGFGDPIFGKSPPQVKTTRIAGKRGYGSFFRVGTADLDLLARALPQLPDTAIELRAVAKSLGASEGDLKLGSAATVTAVKQSPLDQYRIVYFATHALVSGETEQAAKGLAEPALVFSLPATATAFDDGLLTASEAAQLKLNADWVVLSACNTAAAEKPGAEALSGLARAFFYAGARALLVSHWPVESDVAAQLMTTMFASIAKDPKLTTAEALRQAMLSTMDDRAHPDWAIPSSWAPFILVGEGGIMRK